MNLNRILRYLWWIFLVSGTTYLVGWKDWSIGTYIFMLFLMNLKKGEPFLYIKFKDKEE